MARIIVTDPAHADQIAVLGYLRDKAGRIVATKYVALFKKLNRLLSEHPQCCPTRNVLGPHIRVGIIRPYIVIYRYDERDDLVSILRIIHGSQKISRKLISR